MTKIIKIQSGNIMKLLTTFNSSANELALISSKRIFPYLHNNKSCTAILLTNLAEPQWIQISCEKKYVISDVLCLTETYNDISLVTITDSKLYDKECVIQNTTCYLFLWLRTILKSLKILKSKTVYKGSAKKFEYLFLAVDVIFPPILYERLGYFLTYERYGNYYHYEKLNITENEKHFLMITEKNSKDIIIGHNIFKCKGNVYISHIYACDGTEDCPDSSKLDEVGCYCKHANNYSSKCKYITTNSYDNLVKHCSPFYYKTVQGDCKMYHLENRLQGVKQISKEIFPCHDGETLKSPILLNDFLSECRSKVRNEYSLKYILSNNSQNYCFEKNKLPCIRGQTICFSISEICAYKLNEQNTLDPCRAGNHLQNCTNFECNMMFKCPGYYCIPWGYVCNGIWDCPGGYDESIQHQCSLGKRKCMTMLKCVLSNICVHLGDICNGLPDCIMGDDEYLCSLNDQTCPNKCECLTYMVRCIEVSNSLDSFFTIPYFILEFKHCPKVFTENFILKANSIVFLKIKHNDIENVCNGIHYKETIIMDAAHNSISIMLSNCFRQSKKIRVVNLNTNKITTVQDKAFSDLPSLIFLNLANNFLMEIHSNVIVNINSLIILSLANNSLKHLSSDSFTDMSFKVILTNDYRVCCILTKNTKCPARPPWYKSCVNLLPNIYIKITFYCLSLLIIAGNITSLLYLKFLKMNTAFDIIVRFVNFSDLLCGIYISILWIADIIFMGEFALEESNWISHPICFVAFGVSLLFSLFSPSILLFMSLSRLLIVIYPLDPQLKDINLVMKLSISIFCSTIVLAFLFTSSMYYFYRQIPLSLCSPFVDPNNKVILIRSITWFTVILQLLSVVFIITIYVLLFRKLLVSQKDIEVSKKKSNFALLVHILVVTSSNVICWIPSGVIYLSSIFKDKYPIEMIIWTTISCTTINSAINPIVFIITYLRKEKK